MNTKAKHTPGPFKVLCVNVGDRIELRIIAGQREVCPDVYGDTQAERVANACLFRTSAEMLAALKGLVQATTPCRADYLNPCWDGRRADVPGRHWSGLAEACEVCTAKAAIAKAEGGL